jgi:hypothetical protein
MAEIFGVVAGLISLAGVYTSCLECFYNIQLGQNFNNDYGKSQVKLDVVALRLSRWGLAAGLNDFDASPTELHIQATKDETKIAQQVLSELLECLQEARKAAGKFDAKRDKTRFKTVISEESRNNLRVFFMLSIQRSQRLSATDDRKRQASGRRPNGHFIQR